MLALLFALHTLALAQVYSSPTENIDDDLGTIIFSSVLFRHGDRSPTQSYPTDPYNDVKKYWPRGYGQLSQIGEQQHYELGQFLRRRYSRLLPATYNVNDTLVRSTDVDRTLASALCNLAGLYPLSESGAGITFQAIPVHTEVEQNDKLLQPSSSCRKYASLLAMVRKSAEFQCVNQTMALMQNEVTKYTGFPVYNSIIYDILHIESLYNLTLPAWTKDYYPSPLREYDLFQFFITSASTTELQKLAIGPLLKQIVGNMVGKARGGLVPDRRLLVYSAHDTTVVDMLQALRVFNGMMVPYASTVLLELREKQHRQYVTVSYKNSTDADSYLLQLPECDSLCPLEQFVNLTKPVIPDDEHKECAEEPEPTTKIHIQIPVSAIVPQWQHCFENSTVKDGFAHMIVGA